MASTTCKRRKVSAIPNSSSSSTYDEYDAATSLCLSDLPTGILKHAATYLHLPSRILLSVALDDKDSSHDNNSSSSSSSSGSSWGNAQDEWNGILDFGQIEKSLAEKLTDDHIHSILISLDAVNTVKTLRLTNCTNITGVGLEPLRGSTIIEHIDLQIIENHRSPTLDPDLGEGYYISIPDNSVISCGHVLPIVNSIIDRGMEMEGGCALKYLRLPHSFREDNHHRRGELCGLRTTVARYRELMLSRGGWNCSRCNKGLPHGDSDGDTIEFVETEGNFLKQKYTCSSCLKKFCYDCSEEGSYYNSSLQSCAMCEMDYCIDCMKMNACNGECNKSYCVGCMPVTHCSNCESAREAKMNAMNYVKDTYDPSNETTVVRLNELIDDVNSSSTTNISATNGKYTMDGLLIETAALLKVAMPTIKTGDSAEAAYAYSLMKECEKTGANFMEEMISYHLKKKSSNQNL